MEVFKLRNRLIDAHESYVDGFVRTFTAGGKTTLQPGRYIPPTHDLNAPLYEPVGSRS